MKQRSKEYALPTELVGLDSPDYMVINNNVELHLLKLRYDEDGSLELGSKSDSIVIVLNEFDLLEMLAAIRGDDHQTY